MIDFNRGTQEDADKPVPLTWDYCQRFKKDGGAHWALGSEQDLALCTCANGHTTRMTGSIDRVAEDGSVTSSYVGPVGVARSTTGCASSVSMRRTSTEWSCSRPKRCARRRTRCRLSVAMTPGVRTAARTHRSAARVGRCSSGGSTTRATPAPTVRTTRTTSYRHRTSPGEMLRAFNEDMRGGPRG